MKLSRKKAHIDEELFVEIESLIKRMPTEFENYYLDIGAHDGRTASNTFHLDHIYKWHGILVEPIVHLLFYSKNVRSRTRNIFVNAACVGPQYGSSLIRLHYCNLMTIAPEISEYNSEEWILGGKEFLPSGEHILETWAPARTANSILIEHGAPQKIGLVSIDVEGAEYEVLKGIDFNSTDFGIVLIETSDNSLAQRSLMDAGYRLYKHIGQNKIFLNPTFQ